MKCAAEPGGARLLSALPVRKPPRDPSSFLIPAAAARAPLRPAAGTAPLPCRITIHKGISDERIRSALFHDCPLNVQFHGGIHGFRRGGLSAVHRQRSPRKRGRSQPDQRGLRPVSGHFQYRRGAAYRHQGAAQGLSLRVRHLSGHVSESGLFPKCRTCVGPALHSGRGGGHGGDLLGHAAHQHCAAQHAGKAHGAADGLHLCGHRPRAAGGRRHRHGAGLALAFRRAASPGRSGMDRHVPYRQGAAGSRADRTRSAGHCRDGGGLCAADHRGKLRGALRLRGLVPCRRACRPCSVRSGGTPRAPAGGGRALHRRASLPRSSDCSPRW